jgi:hypothetical protein
MGFSKLSLQGGGNILQREVASNYTTFLGRGPLCYGFGCEFGFASCCPLPLLNFAIPGTWLLFPSLLYCRG